MKLPFGNAPGGHVDAELLSSYLDNQVSAAEQSRIDAHLRVCQACRAELNSLRQTVALLQAMPRVPLPRAFTLSQAQVGARRGATGWTWGAARALGAVAALVVVAALAVLVLRQPGQPAATQAPPIAANFANQATATGSAPGALPTQASAAPQAPALPAAPVAPSAATQPQASPQAQAPTAPAQQAGGQSPAPEPPAAQRAAAPTTAQRPATKSAPSAGASSTSGAEQQSQPMIAAAPPAATVAGPASAAAAAAAAAAAPSAGTFTQTPQASAAANPVSPLLAPAAPGSAQPEATPLLGLGGGAGPASAADNNPAPLPPVAAPGAVFSASTGVAYSDGQNLVVIDAGGTRTLMQAPGIGEVTIAADRSWIAYRVMNGANTEIWAVRWNGQNAHQLAGDGNLPPHADSLAGSAHIGQMRWIPGTHNLALTITWADGNGQGSQNELWSVNADNGGLHKVVDLQQASSYAYAPGGKALAVLDRPYPGQPDGKLLLFSIDSQGSTPAGAGRTVLPLSGSAGNYMTDTQLAWLPDGSALWAAIPSADASYPDHPGLDLYRVPLNGKATLAGRVPGLDIYWSPNGKALVYTQPLAGNPDGRQLVLANADGSSSHVAATLTSGTFIGWAPDSRHFLYADGALFYVGDGGEPQALGSIVGPHWVGANQLLYLLDQPNSWALISYTLGGQPVTVAQMPQGIPVDMIGH